MIFPRFLSTTCVHDFVGLPVGNCYFSIHNSIEMGRAECRHASAGAEFLAGSSSRFLFFLQDSLFFPMLAIVAMRSFAVRVLDLDAAMTLVFFSSIFCGLLFFLPHSAGGVVPRRINFAKFYTS